MKISRDKDFHIIDTPDWLAVSEAGEPDR